MDSRPHQSNEPKSLDRIEHQLDLPPPLSASALGLSHFALSLLKGFRMSPEEKEAVEKAKRAELKKYLIEIKGERKRKAGGAAWTAIRRGEVAYVESATGVIFKGR